MVAEPRKRELEAELQNVLERLVAELRDSAPGDDEGPGVIDVVVDGYRCLLVVETASRAHVPLSPREQEIARMIELGYPNKTIAATLGISTWTVSTHLRRMFAKLGVRSRAALVARLLEDELLALHPHRVHED